jgi:hypothetical protein
MLLLLENIFATIGPKSGMGASSGRPIISPSPSPIGSLIRITMRGACISSIPTATAATAHTQSAFSIVGS